MRPFYRRIWQGSLYKTGDSVRQRYFPLNIMTPSRCVSRFPYLPHHRYPIVATPASLPHRRYPIKLLYVIGIHV